MTVDVEVSLQAMFPAANDVRQTAYAVGADACRACGLCVVACPEDAIALVRR